jgi:hypothetical protein
LNHFGTAQSRDCLQKCPPHRLTGPEHQPGGNEKCGEVVDPGILVDQGGIDSLATILRWEGYFVGEDVPENLKGKSNCSSHFY